MSESDNGQSLSQEKQRLLYAWAATGGEPSRLVDIPTTMTALTEAVRNGQMGA